MKHFEEKTALHPQFLMEGNHPAYAVLPIQEYKALLKRLDDLEDNRAFDEVIHSDEEIYPSAVVFELIEGKNPLAIWRTYRGLSKVELAKKAKISIPYLSQLESGKRTPSLETLRTIAKVLKVDMELLMPLKDEDNLEDL